jgi:hypothetical protein
MVHVRNGCQHSAYTDAGTSIAEIELTPDLDSDKFRCFNQRDKFDSAR